MRHGLALVFALGATACLSACSDDELGSARGILVVEPASLDFRQRAPRSETTLPLVLRNQGTVAINLSGAEIRDDTRGAFRPGPLPASLAPGESRELVVTYVAPANPGQDKATLVLASTAHNAPSLSVPLIGDTLPATCTDHLRNGLESGVDCGGPDCAGCPAGGPCAEARDCGEGLGCVEGVCGACTLSTDCREGQVCEAGVCTGCRRDVDCAAGSTCVEGVCTVCEGDERIDTQTDPAHCGACGNACPAPAHAPATCVAGRCGRGACEQGFFDITDAFGCESTCAARVCTDGEGGTVTVSNEPLPERGGVARAFASGSSFGGAVQTSAGHTNVGVLGEGIPLARDVPQQSSRLHRHTGGLIATQQ